MPPGKLVLMIFNWPCFNLVQSFPKLYSKGCGSLSVIDLWSKRHPLLLPCLRFIARLCVKGSEDLCGNEPCFISLFKKFLTAAHGMWDLSSLTSDQTPAPCVGSVES